MRLAFTNIVVDSAGEKPNLRGGTGAPPYWPNALADTYRTALKTCMNLLIGVQYNRSIGMGDEADGQPQFELAALRLIAHPALKSRFQYMQLRFAHGAFQAQKKTGVEVSRIAGTVFIENECVGQRCELNQAMPICIVPREPGHFQSEIAAWPIATSDTSFWKPSRCCALAPERPRSLSMK